MTRAARRKEQELRLLFNRYKTVNVGVVMGGLGQLP